MSHWLIAAADFVKTGGMDIANWHLARHIAQHSTVDLVTHRADDDLLRNPRINVTTVRRPFGMNLLGEPILRRHANSMAHRVLAEGGHVVANGGNCFAPDINWVHYVHAAFTPVTVCSLARRLKSRYYHRRCLVTEREAFRAARVIVCNSKLSARQVVEYCGAVESKTRVVYLGNDPDLLKPIDQDERKASRAMLNWDDSPRVIFVGALADRRKGFDILYDAWRALCREPGWDVHLAVVGRGAELESWKQRAKTDGLEHRIEFLGFRRDVPAILAACDVMVHPARYEAYGLGVQEAVARGLPAIVSAAAGISEQIAGTLGDLTLHDPENVAELVETLKRWRQKLEHYRTITRPLAERLRHYTWDDMAREFLKQTAP